MWSGSGVTAWARGSCVGLRADKGMREPKEMRTPCGGPRLAPAQVRSGNGRKTEAFGVCTGDHSTVTLAWGRRPLRGIRIRLTPVTAEGFSESHFMAFVRFPKCVEARPQTGDSSVPGLAPRLLCLPFHQPFSHSGPRTSSITIYQELKKMHIHRPVLPYYIRNSEWGPAICAEGPSRGPRGGHCPSLCWLEG